MPFYVNDKPGVLISSIDTISEYFVHAAPPPPHLFNLSGIRPNCDTFPNSEGKLPAKPCLFNDTTVLDSTLNSAIFTVFSVISSDWDLECLEGNLLASPVFNHPDTVDIYPLMIFDNRINRYDTVNFYFNLVLRTLYKSRGDYVVFVQPDVYLPEFFFSILASKIASLPTGNKVIGIVGISRSGTIAVCACDLVFSRCWDSAFGDPATVVDSLDEIVIVLPRFVDGIIPTLDECHPSHHLMAANVNIFMKGIIVTSYAVRDFVLHKGRSDRWDLSSMAEEGSKAMYYLRCKYAAYRWSRALLPIHTVNFGTINEPEAPCEEWVTSYCKCQQNAYHQEPFWRQRCS